jgi:DNA-binding CsgD family transcriptional regulator
MTNADDDELTPREILFLRLIASGWTNARLSRRFDTTIGRSEQVRTSIYRKLGAVNAPHAVQLAYERDLFKAPRPRQ